MKLISLIGFELAKYGILEAVMKEFIRRGLDGVYATEITEWKKYKREKKYTKKIVKKIRVVMEEFETEIKGWKPDKLEELVIEGLDCLEPGM